MRNITNIKVGDIVRCSNAPDHDYETYILIIDSVERDSEFITESNPSGIVAFGRGYTTEENEYIEEAGYTFRCSEENFVNYLLDGDEEKICLELNNDMTNILVHGKDGNLYSYVVMGTGDERSNEIVGYISIIEEQELFEWLNIPHIPQVNDIATFLDTGETCVITRIDNKANMANVLFLDGSTGYAPLKDLKNTGKSVSLSELLTQAQL